MIGGLSVTNNDNGFCGFFRRVTKRVQPVAFFITTASQTRCEQAAESPDMAARLVVDTRQCRRNPVFRTNHLTTDETNDPEYVWMPPSSAAS